MAQQLIRVNTTPNHRDPAPMKPESESPGIRGILTVIACVLVIGAAGYLIARALMPTRTLVPNAYFLDQNTRKIFVAPASMLAPVATPSGNFENEPAGVRLFLFSCTPCPSFDGKTLDDAKAMGVTIGWVERYSPEAKRKLDAGDTSSETVIEGLQLRAATGGRWLSPGTREATALRETVSRMCAGNPGKACNPE